jgi:acetyl-CoA carboxylase biotin carboxyl carrier protein
MVAVRTMRQESWLWAWLLAALLSLLLVLAVLTRVAGARPEDPPRSPPAGYIVCPVEGLFLAGPHPGAEPYVSEGSPVEPGTVVGQVEVWGKLHPVHSMVRGVVIEVLVASDLLVEMGQPLFKVRLESEPEVDSA